MKCDLCNRKLGRGHFIWILEHTGYKNLTLCKECNMSASEQMMNAISKKDWDYSRRLWTTLEPQILEVKHG